MIWRLLSSLTLTIPLLLALSLVAVFGTLAPNEQGRYELFYQSLWFRFLLGLLALNLLACTIRTAGRQWRMIPGCFDDLHPERLAAHTRTQSLDGTSGLTECGERLVRLGFRVRIRENVLVAHRALWGRWGSTVVHLSLLLIMIGALFGGAGFVGTTQLYVDRSTTTYFDWDSQQELPLGFEFRLDYFEPIYYPIHVRFVVNRAGGDQVLATLTAHEGETVPLPVPGYSARVEKFIPIEKRLVLNLYRERELLGAYDAFPVGNRKASANVFGMTIHPDAFQDPLLKQLHSEVSVLRDGRVVKQGIIEVNQPLVFEGVTIYQTAFNQDQFGFWYAGFQMTRDPGEPLVWAGCVSLVLGFVLAFVMRPQALGVVSDSHRLLLVPLRGFVGEGGARALDELLRRLRS
ncbi:MAG: hypothetical protein A2X84_11690 [Desulfuromonadaceae bacterium GWC2_58_13]|nr:MAG: hypothetical protein A2X84_11690 [Desulfuromonadaceae bacterium GWC2_58_13]